MVGDVVCALERGELAQILADGVAVGVDIVIERMAARNEHDAARFHRVGRAVIRRQQAGFRADGNGFMHAAIGGRHAVRAPIIGDGLVTVHVVVAGVGRQLPAHAAGRHAHEVVIARRTVDDFAGIEVLRLVDFLHEGLPERRGGVAARRFGGERLVVVVADPDGAGIPARHAGEEHALAVRVRAGLARDDLRGNLRLGTRAALHGLLEHIHHEIRRRGLEHLMAILLLVHIHHDVAVAVHNAGEGERLLIHALVGDGAEGDGHLHRGEAGGAERQTERIGVDVFIGDAHQVQIFHRTGHAHVGHQNLRRGGVIAVAQRAAEALRPLVSAAAVVLRPRILAAGILPAGNRNGHVVGD